MATPLKQDLKSRLKRDVEAALAKEFGSNPKLIAEIEGALAKVAEVAASDVISGIKSPVIRMLLKAALHDEIEKALDV